MSAVSFKQPDAMGGLQRAEHLFCPFEPLACALDICEVIFFAGHDHQMPRRNEAGKIAHVCGV